MPKTKVTDWDATAANNTEINSIGIEGTSAVQNFDNALREKMSQWAKVNAGTDPVADTWSFADPADLTKIFRLDAGSITTATTRVITVPDRDLTLGSAFQATPVTLSGSSTDFTIPSWANRIDIAYSGVQHNDAGTQNFLIQLGDSGGIETTGYLGGLGVIGGSPALFTSGIGVIAASSSTAIVHGNVTLSKVSADGTKWSASGNSAFSNGAGLNCTAASKTLTTALTTVRFMVTAGSFVAGVVTAVYS